jgi:ABC-type transport system involved in multi-copper enzyme maturation permease subunit
MSWSMARSRSILLGILVVSCEYGTGTILAALAAAPRRPMVLAAKILVFGSVSLAVSEIVAFASFLLGQALLTSPARHAMLSSPGALRAVAGIGLFLCVAGLFALGIAVLVRHTAGAISAYIGLILVLPLIVGAFPSSRARRPSAPTTSASWPTGPPSTGRHKKPATALVGTSAAASVILQTDAQDGRAG